VVVVIMGFRRISMGENWARSFVVSSLSWTFSRWRLKVRLVSDIYYEKMEGEMLVSEFLLGGFFKIKLIDH
jgi:hypothetical protein